MSAPRLCACGCGEALARRHRESHDSFASRRYVSDAHRRRDHEARREAEAQEVIRLRRAGLSIVEAARRLGLAKQTVSRMCKEAELAIPVVRGRPRRAARTDRGRASGARLGSGGLTTAPMPLAARGMAEAAADWLRQADGWVVFPREGRAGLWVLGTRAVTEQELMETAVRKGWRPVARGVAA